MIFQVKIAAGGLRHTRRDTGCGDVGSEHVVDSECAVRVAREEGVLAVGFGEDILRVVHIASGERLQRIGGSRPIDDPLLHASTHRVVDT